MRLMESFLYNTSFIDRSLIMVFRRDFGGGGAKIFGRNAMTTDLRRLVKKIVEML